jgi:hypothetical protein
MTMSKKNREKMGDRMREYWAKKKEEKELKKNVYLNKKITGPKPQRITFQPAEDVKVPEEEENEEEEEKEKIIEIKPTENIQEETEDENSENPLNFQTEIPEEKEYKKILPESDLELNYYFTNPQWGDESVNKDLQEMFKRKEFRKVPRGVIVKMEDGKEYISDGTIKQPVEKNYWAELAFLTRDLRLANYDKKTYNFCSYMYELAGAMLNAGYIRAGLLAMQIGAIHGEMSQGKGGFLRQMQNTLIKKEQVQQMEVKRNNILSGKPKDDYNYGG